MSEFDKFYGNPTPENAVRLAAADHRAQKIIDHDFLLQLNRAVDSLAASPDLLSACQAALALLQDGDAEPCDADRVTTILVAAIHRATRN